MGNRLWEGTTETCVHRDPGERSSDPTRDWTRLVCECLGVSSRAMDQRWHDHRELIKLFTGTTALSNSMKLWAMPCRPPRTDGSWCRVLTKCGSLEKGMANYFSILAWRTPWTVWKGKKIHTTMYIITNKDLLCSIGNYILYFIIIYKGKESEKRIYIYICITLLYTWN